jgi:hypothetical protein
MGIIVPFFSNIAFACLKLWYRPLHEFIEEGHGILMRFDQNGSISDVYSHSFYFIEQNGLAHAAQSRQENTFFGTLREHATQKYASLPNDSFTTGKFRRWRAGSWRERIFYSIHGSPVYIHFSYLYDYIRYETEMVMSPDYQVS